MNDASPPTRTRTTHGDGDPTVVAVGTSVMWSTGNTYRNKFPNLVHADLTGDYPIDEQYLHYKQGPSPPGSSDDPTPAYYEQTDADYDGQDHPNGDPLPPKQYRARGGAIIGLSPPAPVLFGDQSLSDQTLTDEDAPGGGNNYLARNADGSYYGKLDFVDDDAVGYADEFDPDDIDASQWLVARDIGWSWPTIPDQIDQFDRTAPSTVDVPTGDIDLFGDPPDDQAPAGEDVDLVLLDGGTNDLTLGWLNNPMNANRETIWRACRRYMYRDMGTLIDRARRTFPEAVIVVLGYPLWASNRVDRPTAKKLLVANNKLALLPEIVERAVDNVLNFVRSQAYWLRRTVTEKSKADDGPGIVIAPPGYGAVNGMMADWPWAFGYEPDEPGYEDPGITDDAVRRVRYNVCKAEWEAERPCGEDDCEGSPIREEVGKWTCYNAPIGHPNAEGCRQYADTIIRRYKRHISRSVRATTDELDGGTTSVRDSLERFGLGPDGATLRDGLPGDDVGLDWALSNRVVDSITVTLRTGNQDQVGSGAKQGRPYLEVYPGRSGRGERFALDTEDRDYAADSTDEFRIDPMMRRRITGPVGNVDSIELPENVGMFETLEQTTHPTGHWSDRRLKLGDVEHLVLVLDEVDPGDGWALTEATYELNGAIEGSRDLGADFSQLDFRARTRGRRFQLASFNHVPAVDDDDLLVGISVDGYDVETGRGVAVVEGSLTVSHTVDRRVPGVMIQYGLRTNGSGRDWQVQYVGEIGPNESEDRDITLESFADPGFFTANRQGDVELLGSVFVGDAAAWVSTTTTLEEL